MNKLTVSRDEFITLYDIKLKLESYLKYSQHECEAMREEVSSEILDEVKGLIGKYNETDWTK